MTFTLNARYWKVADPQLQFFENFESKGIPFRLISVSTNRLSVHAVNIPLSIMMNNVYMLVTLNGTSSNTVNFGLYSMNAGTLSLANSGSMNPTWELAASAVSWTNFGLSATQNITPGTWYLAINQTASSGFGYLGNSSVNVSNAPPVFIRGRATVTFADMPASLATSDLLLTLSSATRQPYILITS